MTSWEGLEEIVAVADTGAFVRAAALGLSTSQVSRAVAGLESRLGVQLFVRTTRRVALTDTGRVMVDHARRLIQERDDLISQVNGTSEPQGELRITCPVSLGESVVAPLTRAYLKENPRTSIHLELTNRVVDVTAEGFDLAVRTGSVIDARLTGVNVTGRAIETCASPDYLSIHGEPSSVELLSRHRCLLATSGAWTFKKNGAPWLFKPSGPWRCNSGNAVAAAAVEGDGVCQLPTFYLRDHIAAGRLTPILTAFRNDPEPVWILYPLRRHLLPKVRRFADLLEARLRTILLEGWCNEDAT